jgi:hypothetical protein
VKNKTISKTALLFASLLLIIQATSAATSHSFVYSNIPQMQARNVLTEKNDGASITVSKGSIIKVALENRDENEWIFKNDSNNLNVQTEEQSDKRDFHCKITMGHKGETVLTFALVKPYSQKELNENFECQWKHPFDESKCQDNRQPIQLLKINVTVK